MGWDAIQDSRVTNCQGPGGSGAIASFQGDGVAQGDALTGELDALEGGELRQQWEELVGTGGPQAHEKAGKRLGPK